jgi:hypothetical protein
VTCSRWRDRYSWRLSICCWFAAREILVRAPAASLCRVLQALAALNRLLGLSSAAINCSTACSALSGRASRDGAAASSTPILWLLLLLLLLRCTSLGSPTIQLLRALVV